MRRRISAMKVIVLGAGIIGIATAWHLLEEGHEVTVVDRQPEAALETGIEYDRLERGILHFFSSAADYENGVKAAALMRDHGVDRRVLDRDAVLAVEPALKRFGGIHGGTFTPSDESGDARVFTQKLAQ